MHLGASFLVRVKIGTRTIYIYIYIAEYYFDAYLSLAFLLYEFEELLIQSGYIPISKSRYSKDIQYNDQNKRTK